MKDPMEAKVISERYSSSASGTWQQLKRFYRGTSLIRNNPPLGLYCRTKPRALWWS